MRPHSATTALVIASCAHAALACNANDWNRVKPRFGSAEARYALGQEAEADADGTPDYELVAEQGYVPAQIDLGALYAEGCAVDRGDDRAMNWFRKAAETENGLGQVNLGIGQFEGRGVAHDLVAAHMWFTLSDAGATERRREEVEAVLSRAELEKLQKFVADWRQAHRRS